ncbi:MAG: peptidase T [Bacteroidaceae bacterium]|nr:peptidase T [Bacteroidaceae bacterium]
MKQIVARFLKYASFNTQSDEAADCTPSTNGQLNFANYLQTEMKQIGLEDISIDDSGYLFGTLSSNLDTTKEVPVIGFIAHLDTSPDMTGENVKPSIVSNYKGVDIPLDKDAGIILSPSDFPELLKYKGDDLIVTDGHTLLGADDKAGIAEIMEACSYLKQHPEIKHGKVRVAFTPDEEIGLGAKKFDVSRFGAQWAYTIDGGELGELEFENFNAASATVFVKGRNVHPGSAKDKMRNSMLLAQEFIASLPSDETPATTEGYEGFYHLNGLSGDVELTELNYIIRDHDTSRFEERKQMMQTLVDNCNEKFGMGIFSLQIHDQYYNMRKQIEPVMHIIDLASQAMKECEVVPIIKPIRGGTDGAQLSFKGLPCPNIFAGGVNFHGRYEFLPVSSLEKSAQVIAKIVELTAK